FDRFALSRAGAQGIMQVMPFWKNELGRPDDNLIDLATNLRYGCTILKYYLDLEKGDLRRALARYNGSLGSHRYPDKVQEYWYRYWYGRDSACALPVLIQQCQQASFGLQPRRAVHQRTGGSEDVGGRQHLWARQLQTLLEVLPHHRKGNPHAVGQFAQLLTADTVVIDAEYADIRPRRRQPVELRQLVQTGSTPLCPVVDHHPVALQLGPGHGFALVIAPLLAAAAGQPERCNHQRYPQPLSHAPSPSAFAWPSSASQLRRLPSSTCRRQS